VRLPSHTISGGPYEIHSVAALIIAFVTPASAQAPNIAIDEFMVQSEPGIEIYVRNKRPAGMSAFRPERTVLFVHGSTYPASTSFDLKLGDTSWMEYIATRGYDVYLLDLRGYGRTTRPKKWRTTPRPTHPLCVAQPL
jgi:pimeloyl-ACP methyl ester carboxylesterase